MTAVIGAGTMGEALMVGWIAAGTSPDGIVVVDQDTDRLARLRERHGVCSVEMSRVSVAEVVVMVVRPHHVTTALINIIPHLGPEAVVVSVAAGVTLARLTEVLSEGQPMIRVMPNTPVPVSRRAADLAAGPTVTPEQIVRVVAMMEAVGIYVELPESQFDALTAISGSGPVHLFLIVEVMIEVGVHRSLGRDVATRLANGTFAGAAAMLEGVDVLVTELRGRVTSPAGTTATALRMLDERAVRAAFLVAVEACARRSSKLRTGNDQSQSAIRDTSGRNVKAGNPNRFDAWNRRYHGRRTTGGDRHGSSNLVIPRPRFISHGM